MANSLLMAQANTWGLLSKRPNRVLSLHQRQWPRTESQFSVQGGAAMISKIIAAVIGFCIASTLSSVMLMTITSRNRKAEWDKNDETEAPDQNHLYWTVIHIRDCPSSEFLRPRLRNSRTANAHELRLHGRDASTHVQPLRA
jgi:hypothetical protein